MAAAPTFFYAVRKKGKSSRARVFSQTGKSSSCAHAGKAKTTGGIRLGNVAEFTKARFPCLESSGTVDGETPLGKRFSEA